MMGGVPDTWFVIPAYNEGSAIGEVIRGIPDQYGVVCIDDGSTDDTASQIAATRAVLVRHPINMGQGGALQTGFDYTLTQPSMRYVVTFDADGQHGIADVEAMLEIIRAKGVDVVMGSRFLGNAVNMPRSKRAILKTAIRFSNLVSGVKLSDTHNGLRVLSRHAVEQMQLTMPDFAHASEIVERIAQKKLTYVEAPVTIVYSEYSRSKGQSLVNAINIAFDVMMNKVVGS